MTIRACLSSRVNPTALLLNRNFLCLGSLFESRNIANIPASVFLELTSSQVPNLKKKQQICKKRQLSKLKKDLDVLRSRSSSGSNVIVWLPQDRWKDSEKPCTVGRNLNYQYSWKSLDSVVGPIQLQSSQLNSDHQTGKFVTKAEPFAKMFDPPGSLLPVSI